MSVSKNYNYTSIFVSVPRSGHHLMVNMLKEYYGDEFKYCEFYNKACCDSYPCSNPLVKIQKHHDMDLKLKILNNFRYVIGYRDFLKSTISDFELFCRGDKLGVCDNEESWLMFSFSRLSYWKKFIHKWVLPYQSDSRFFFLRYEYNLKY